MLLLIAWDLLNDGQFNDLDDWRYAVGTGHFGHSTLKATCVSTSNKAKCERCCESTVVGMVSMYDQFNFPSNPGRKISATWSAGMFLQAKCKYPGVEWELNCNVNSKYKECEKTQAYFEGMTPQS